jgi:beta-phosphoglucomutase-like phosphatase (HAD superfamily)
MDGVVVDSEPLYQKAEESLFKEYGVTIPQEDWKLFRGCTEEHFYDLARNRYGIKEPLEILRKQGRKRVLEEFETGLDYIRGFLELHQRLAEHYRLGLVTSTPGDIFQWMDEKIGLNRYFDDVIYGGMTPNSKPHPEPYLTMMHRLGSTASETAIVEDSINGLTSALDSGAWTIALTGSVPIEDMPRAHALIHSLEEITIPFLDNLMAEAHALKGKS